MSAEPTVHCEVCGTDYTFGAFPFCRGNPSDHGPWIGAEEPIEALPDEHLTDEPGGITFTTMREKVRYMDKHAIQPHRNRESWKPGTLVFDMGRR